MGELAASSSALQVQQDVFKMHTLLSSSSCQSYIPAAVQTLDP
jgi:hypothetical protein